MTDDTDILALLAEIGSDPPPPEGWPQHRCVVVVDPGLLELGRALAAALRDRDFIVVEPAEIDEENVDAVVAGRLLVTNRGVTWVWEASSYGVGVVALDLLLDGEPLTASAVARRISDAVVRYGIDRRRHAWCLVLLPDGGAVLRALLS